MALPKIDKPMYKLTLPSNGKEVLYRAMLAKEEKILLIAQQESQQASQSKDANKIAEAAKQAILASLQVVNNCTITDNIVSEQMSMIDFEYLFVGIRAKSQMNIIDITLNDEHKKKISVEVDIENIEVMKNDEHSNVVKLSDDITLIMRYPNLTATLKRIDASLDPSIAVAVQYEIMRDCMDSIVDGDDVTKFDDEKISDIDEWIDDLDRSTLSKIDDFFTTAPVLKYSFPYIDSKGEKKTLNIQGFESFFT
jgi:hypothetical protein